MERELGACFFKQFESTMPRWWTCKPDAVVRHPQAIQYRIERVGYPGIATGLSVD